MPRLESITPSVSATDRARGLSPLQLGEPKPDRERGAAPTHQNQPNRGVPRAAGGGSRATLGAGPQVAGVPRGSGCAIPLPVLEPTRRNPRPPPGGTGGGGPAEDSSVAVCEEHLLLLCGTIGAPRAPSRRATGRSMQTRRPTAHRLLLRGEGTRPSLHGGCGVPPHQPLSPH